MGRDRKLHIIPLIVTVTVSTMFLTSCSARDDAGNWFLSNLRLVDLSSVADCVADTTVKGKLVITCIKHNESLKVVDND